MSNFSTEVALVSAEIPWEHKTIEKGKTVVKVEHFDEILPVLQVIEDAVSVHEAGNTSATHLPVVAGEPGFVTPNILWDIKYLHDRIDRMAEKTITETLPSSIAIMYKKDPSQTPRIWEWCDGTNGTFDSRNNVLIGGNQSDSNYLKTYAPTELAEGSGNREDYVKSSYIMRGFPEDTILVSLIKPDIGKIVYSDQDRSTTVNTDSGNRNIEVNMHKVVYLEYSLPDNKEIKSFTVNNKEIASPYYCLADSNLIVKGEAEDRYVNVKLENTSNTSIKVNNNSNSSVNIGYSTNSSAISIVCIPNNSFKVTGFKITKLGRVDHIDRDI